MDVQTVTYEFSTAPSVSNWVSETAALSSGDSPAYTVSYDDTILSLGGATGIISESPGDEWIPVGIKVYAKVGMYDGFFSPVLPEEPFRLRLSLTKDGGSTFGSETFLVSCRDGTPTVQRDAGNDNTIWGLGDLTYNELISDDFFLCFNIPTDEIDESDYLPIRSVSYAYMDVTFVNRKTGSIELEGEGDCSGEIPLTVTEE